MYISQMRHALIDTRLASKWQEKGRRDNKIQLLEQIWRHRRWGSSPSLVRRTGLQNAPLSQIVFKFGPKMACRNDYTPQTQPCSEHDPQQCVGVQDVATALKADSIRLNLSRA